MASDFEQLTFNIEPSRLYRAIVTFLHALLLPIFWLLLDDRDMLAVLLSIWLISLIVCVRISQRRYRLCWYADGSWEAWKEGTHLGYVQLKASYWVLANVVYLPFSERKLGGILIFSDALSESQHRLLRIRLLWAPK